MRTVSQHPSVVVRTLRLRAGLSQRELAKAAGTAPNTVRGAERGRLPTPDNQRRIAQALSLALDEPIDRLDIWPIVEHEAA